MEISKDVFEKELGMCRKHFQKKQCCAWGKCEDCGVIPLLVKLHEGRLVESKENIKKLKTSIFEK